MVTEVETSKILVLPSVVNDCFCVMSSSKNFGRESREQIHVFVLQNEDSDPTASHLFQQHSRDLTSKIFPSGFSFQHRLLHWCLTFSISFKRGNNVSRSTDVLKKDTINEHYNHCNHQNPSLKICHLYTLVGKYLLNMNEAGSQIRYPRQEKRSR